MGEIKRGGDEKPELKKHIECPAGMKDNTGVMVIAFNPSLSKPLGELIDSKRIQSSGILFECEDVTSEDQQFVVIALKPARTVGERDREY